MIISTITNTSKHLMNISLRPYNGPYSSLSTIPANYMGNIRILPSQSIRIEQMRLDMGQIERYSRLYNIIATSNTLDAVSVDSDPIDPSEPVSPKICGIYAGASYTGTTVNISSTLDAVEYNGADTYFFLVSQNDFSTQYDPNTDTWPNLEPLLAEAADRGIDMWATWHNPIHFRSGVKGILGTKMLFRQWMASLAKLSIAYPNFKGTIVDDFGENHYWTQQGAGYWVDENGEDVYWPDYMITLRDGMAIHNPDFRFGSIMYYPYLTWEFIRTPWLAITEYVDDIVWAGYWSAGTSPLITEDVAAIESAYNSQKAIVLQYKLPTQVLWHCPYITSHSWQGASTITAVTKQLDLCLNDADIDGGVYGFTMINDSRIITNTCPNASPTESCQKGRVVYEKFTEYRNR